nr:hypothetical protein [Tanacetum cinerariifolium]
MLVQPHAATEEEDKEDEVPAAPTPPSPTHEPTPPLQEPITPPPQAQSVTPPPSPPQAQPAPPTSPPQEQPTTTSTSAMTLLNALLETCTTLSHKVAALEQDNVAQALEILKLKGRVKKRMHPNKGRIEAIDANEDITLVDMETKVDLGDELQGKLEEKDEVNDAAKEVNVAEPTVFDDEKEIPKFKEETNLCSSSQEKMIVYLKNMVGYKIAHFKGMNYDQESFKKLRAEVEVSGSHSSQDTPIDDPKEMYKEDVKNMLQIVLVYEFKVEALQVKYPLIDWEIHSEGSRSYWKIIRVSGITQAYRSFEDMVKDFDREDLDDLWRLVKEKFSIAMPTEDKEQAL